MSEQNEEMQKETEQEKIAKEKRKWRKVSLYFLVLILLKNNTGARIAAPFIAPMVLEHRYEEPFEYKESIGGEIFLSPVREPEIRVRVEIKSKWVFWAEFEDNYYGGVATHYASEWLRNAFKSKYANPVFTRGSVGQPYDSVEEKYTIQDVKQGPQRAPEIYEKMSFTVDCYCAPENRENVQRELFELYHVIGKKYDLDKVKVRMMVADEEIIGNTPGLLELYEEGRFIEASTAVRVKENALKFWGFSGNKREGTDIERASTDFDYFLNCITVITPNYYESAKNRE